jgi:hypothetical protein
MANNKCCGKANCNKKNCKNGKCKNTTVVDAVSEPVASPPPPTAPVLSVKSDNIKITTVPVSSRPQAPSPEVVKPTAEMIANPSETIRDTAATFYKLHEQYNTLRALAKPLNGLSQANKFPDNVNIKTVNIAFAVDGEEHNAEITSTQIIGDIAGLIGNELRSLIERMYQELFALEHVTTGMQKAVQQAIAATARAADSGTAPVSSAQQAASGITLQPVKSGDSAQSPENNDEEKT